MSGSVEAVAPTDDPEDIFEASLEGLFDLAPITHSSAGSVYTYHTPSTRLPPYSIVLSTPDTRAENWSLHASSIWVSSLYISDHIEELHLEDTSPGTLSGHLHVLELGAGAGLPGILIAKTYPRFARVTSSDYPDEDLISTLQQNVGRNNVQDRCRVVPFAWSSNASSLFPKLDGSDDPSRTVKGFDVIVAADTLWNPDFHGLFIDTLVLALTRTADARIHLVAGMHTGRYTIQSFLNAVSKNTGFEIVEVTERSVKGESRRDWDVGRAEGEDERERRRWVVWIVIRWSKFTLLKDAS